MEDHIKGDDVNGAGNEMQRCPPAGANQNQVNGLKGGSEAKLTKQIAKAICNELAQSNTSLHDLCQLHPDWPAYKTLRNSAYSRPWFKDMMARAREEQADYLAQDGIKLCEKLLTTERLTMPQVQANKVVMDFRAWYTSKILKRIYGDDQQINVDARTAGQEERDTWSQSGQLITSDNC